MQTLNLSIKGMHCQSCKLLIEDVVQDIPGVFTCQVDFDHAQATITHDGTVTFNGVKTAIQELGEYDVLHIT